MDKIKISDRVLHTSFGKGTVIRVLDENILVDFDDRKITDRKTINRKFLSLIHDDDKEKRPKEEKTNYPPVILKKYTEIAHKIYGKGIIQEINGKTAIVLFDNIKGHASIRDISIDFLECDRGREVSVNSFKVGDRVQHLTFGEGEIVEAIPNFKSRVRIQNSGKILVLKNESLISLNVSIIGDDEIQDEEIFDSSFKIIPSNYSQSSYSNSAKRIMTYIRKEYKDHNGIASITSYKTTDGSQTGLIVIPEKGVIIFSLFDDVSDSNIFSQEFYTQYIKEKYESTKKYYIDKFYKCKTFCKFIGNKTKIMNIPIKYVLLYQNMLPPKQIDEKYEDLFKKIYFGNFSSVSGTELFSDFEPYDAEFQKIEASVFGSIVERVIPENVTLININQIGDDENANSGNNPIFRPITGKEREFSAMCLDDDQIKAINDTKEGHYLTLANPGTGKSVLLVSKAFRIQSINRDNHVLITCYNKNLAEHHNLFADISGMKTRNMHIQTFHKMVIDILNRVDPSFMMSHRNFDDEEEFSKIVDRLIALVDAKKVQTKFNAIFIDEIQLFEPKWIDLCYELLDKNNQKNFYFEMYGDINQDVRAQRSKGKASWQNTKLVPSLRGRVRKLDKNYRNSELIAKYLECFIEDFNNKIEKNGLSIDKECFCLPSVTIHKSKLKTKIINSSAKNVEKISEVVLELRKKRKADFNDIAVIYPATGYAKYYAPVYHIQKNFEAKNIPYSFICGNSKVRLYDCDGVVMSTIDSCLGLDFKYVILCGVHFWDLYHNPKTGKTEKFTKEKIECDKDFLNHFDEIGKKIYSACSRAKDGLYIIDDSEKDSPIREILRPKNGRGKYYDEIN